MKMIKQIIHISALAAVVSAFSLSHAAQSPVQISSKVQELVQTVDENGKSKLKAVEANAVVPGDRILYTTTFTNNGNKASDKIVITNPIPNNTRYLGGTATGKDFAITYSVDHGKSWGTAQSLQVKLKDGKVRAAEASDYTHIRWEYRRALQPTEVKAVTFQTQLL